MAKSTIKVNIQWIKEDTDLRECYACKDMIFGELSILTLKVGNSEPTSMDLTLCNSCFDCMDKGI